MILTFDLDDTLYDERTYVESGLLAVARFGEAEFGWDRGESLWFMIGVLDRDGRGAIFDQWLSAHGKLSRELVAECVRCYRHHAPVLALDQRAAALLPQLARYPLYIVTDGHKIVQDRKLTALAIRPLFKHAFITHRYGTKNAKPSLHCFELIRKAEQCRWQDIVYVGDNPAKDFVSLNRVGAQTVRVLTGVHRNAVAAPGFEAQHRIRDLSAFAALLPELETARAAR